MTQFNFKSDEELKAFMKYFHNELPDPEHHPIKARWLRDWWFTIVKRDGMAAKGNNVDTHS